jgi:hypothetical protein
MTSSTRGSLILIAILFLVALGYADLRARVVLLRREVLALAPVVSVLPSEAVDLWQPGDPLPRIPGYNAPEVRHVR